MAREPFALLSSTVALPVVESNNHSPARKKIPKTVSRTRCDVAGKHFSRDIVFTAHEDTCYIPAPASSSWDMVPHAHRICKAYHFQSRGKTGLKKPASQTYPKHQYTTLAISHTSRTLHLPAATIYPGNGPQCIPPYYDGLTHKFSFADGCISSTFRHICIDSCSLRLW